MADDREVFKVRRDAGLAKRHETREARAIRRQVAEEIAQAIEAASGECLDLIDADQDQGFHVGLNRSAVIAREIGSKETT